ncbi:MAG: dihydrodipicolinate synthase family protein [Myxococcota bacterium]
MRPPPGLSVPIVSVLDDDGELIESDQRAVVRHVIQDGYGADVVFAAGTTGEWDHLPNRIRQQVIRTSVEEVGRENEKLGARLARRIECWAGVTAHTAEETLENVACSVECGADAIVLAPLSISGLDDPVRFVARDLADLLDGASHRIPLYLYDNADIAANPRALHIRTRQVKALSRLDFVRGIKVTASRKILGNYTRAAEGFRERGEFAIYVGNASLIFDLFRPRTGLLGSLAEHWSRYRMRGSLPHGVVAGPANALPREWARAWQVCRAGDVERMDKTFEVVDAFRRATVTARGSRTIACLKRALFDVGVISSPALAKGTPELDAESAEEFDRRFEAVRAQAKATLRAPWYSRGPAGAAGEVR